MSNQVTLTLPDGSQKQVEKGTTFIDFIKTQIGVGLAKAALFAKLDDQEFDLTRTIEHDGMHAQLPVFTLAVANCDQYGNRARIAPGAQVDDGRLDLVAIPPVSWANAVPLIARLFSGTIDRARNVTHFRGARFVVHRPAPGLIHTDGECHFAPARIEFIVRPQSLRVLAPAATPAR